MIRIEEPVLVMTVTSLIARSGCEKTVSQDFKEAFESAGDSSHHVSALLFQQENGLSFLISQFRSEDDLRRWRQTDDYRRMIAAFERHSLRELCTINKPVAQITVPNDASGPKWKVFASTWIVTYPLLLCLNGLLGSLAPDMSEHLRIATTSSLLSIAIIWFVAPMVHRVTRTWRLNNQEMRTNIIDMSHRSLHPCEKPGH